MKNTINNKPLEFGNVEQIAWLRKQQIRIEEAEEEPENETLHAIGASVNGDDMHWRVECPSCGREHDYTGFFDSTEITLCKCSSSFVTDRIEFDDGSCIY